MTYYKQEDGTLIRVHEGEYCYMNAQGKWVRDNSLIGKVSGMSGDADVDVITEAEAAQLAQRMGGKL